VSIVGQQPIRKKNKALNVMWSKCW